jgi:hypothetical protein
MHTTTTTSQKTFEVSSGRKRKRGRRYRKGIPAFPAKVLATSIYTGLSALVRLAQRLLTNDPEVIRLVDEITSMWETATKEYERSKREGTPDYSCILAVEHSLRKNFLAILWQTTKPYGNTEKKRIYRWSQGTIGPLNSLLNYAGSVLRSIAMRYFTFPNVTYYQVREFPDGSMKVLPKRTTKKYPPENNVKTYWIAVYPGNAKHPMVKVRHPTLPEMDFVDTLRAHTVELVRQCFIFNVPEKASRQYIRLLIYRLQPYLEWIYTNGKSGTKAFWAGGDNELQSILHEIHALYGRQVGRTARMSHQGDTRPSNFPSIQDIVTQLLRKCNNDKSEGMKQDILEFLRLFGFPHDKHKNVHVHWRTTEEARDTIKPLVEAIGYEMKIIKKHRHPPKACLTDDDAADLYGLMSQLAQREGNEWHRILSGDMFHPFSLKQAIFTGDNFLDAPSDILLAAEVSVSDGYGKGKADIVVFIRRSLGGEIIWTPIMVLDIKTKVGINWSLIGKKPRTDKQDARIPKFATRKRKLTDSEWKQVIASTPKKNELTQLESYETGIISEYRALVKHDHTAPKGLLKGIVLVDPDEDRQEVFSLLPWLVRSVVQQVKEDTFNMQPRTLYTPQFDGMSQKERTHFGLVLEPSKGAHTLLRECVPLENVIEEDPFEDRVKDAIIFTLYLSVPSGGSSGESAAWMARNWHLLHHLKKLRENRHSKVPIVWFDLAGEMGDAFLRFQRLRLLGPQSPSMVTRRKREALQQLVEDIEFIDCREITRNCLFDDIRKGINALESQFREVTEKYADQDHILVIDGWDTLRDITPTHREAALRVLEERIIKWLPRKQVEVIWLDSPVPLPFKSARYQTNRVTPLPHDSPRRYLLDVILWNLPSSPRNFGWVTPRREDIRVIVQDLPIKSAHWSAPFGVPHLRGWAKRFRAESQKKMMVPAGQVAKSKMYGKGFSSSSNYAKIGFSSKQVILNAIYDLVPSFSRGCRSNLLESLPSHLQHVPAHQQLKGQRKQGGIWGRATFESNLSSQPTGRPGVYSHFSKITRGKKRKQLPEPPHPTRTTRRPPFVLPTPCDSLDTEEARIEEIDRIEKVVQFLSKQISPRGWNVPGILQRVAKQCTMYKEGKIQPEELLDSLPVLFSKFDSTIRLWRALAEARSIYGDASAAPRNIRSILCDSPELLTRYCSGLFLLLWRIVYEDEEGVLPHADILWKAMADWQWVHMGFETKTSEYTIHRFDIPTLYSNLVVRASRLAATRKGTHEPYESYKFGEIISDDEEPTLWVLIQEHPRNVRMQVGLLSDVKRDKPLRGTYTTEQDLTGLVEGAEYVLSGFSGERVPVLVTRFEGKDYLWTIAHEDDERTWVLYGEIKCDSTAVDGVSLLQRLTVQQVSEEVVRRLDEPRDVLIPKDLESWTEGALQKVIEMGEVMEHATLTVGLAEASEEYVVEVSDSGGRVFDRRTFSPTEELITFLRLPSKGEIPQAPDGRSYSWHLARDIIYGTDTVRTGRISMSFLRPVVENSRFLGGKYRIPRTAKDVLGTQLGPEVIMVAHPDLTLYRRKQKRCWQVWLVGVEVGEGLIAFQQEYVSVQEIGVISDIKQMIDLDKNIRFPTSFIIDNMEAVELPDSVLERKRVKEYLTRRILKEKTY